MKLPLIPFTATALLSLPLAAADAMPATPAAPAASKTYTLFLGADIDLQQAKEFYRVENVSGGSFVIKVGGQEKKIPLHFTRVNMKVDRGLKLTETAATVRKLVVDRDYSMANDPHTKFTRSLSASAAQAQMSLATGNLGATLLALSQMHNGGGGALIDLDAQLAANQKAFDGASSDLNSDFNSDGFHAGKMAAELAEEMYDAIDVSFEVSSETPLNSPYAVLIAQFAEKGAKPNEAQQWVYATELEPITNETRRIHIKQDGFPRGFEIRSCQLHLYNRGVELATTVAPKRVELTREEAFDYVLIDYLASNKGKTLPPTVALGRLSGTVRATLPKSLYIKVSKDGLPVAAYADEACRNKIDDAAVEAALRDLRFKPALHEGKATDGVVRLGST